jgi:hypothetical protein
LLTLAYLRKGERLRALAAGAAASAKGDIDCPWQVPVAGRLAVMAMLARWRLSRLRRNASHVAFEARRFSGRKETRAEHYADVLARDKGGLAPTVVARYLREIALWMSQYAESTEARARKIEAEYGHVFRTAAYISGKYLHPYRVLRSAPERIATAKKVQHRALVLARALERLSAELARREATDLGVQPVERLITALGDPDESVRLRATGLLGQLGETDAVEALIALLDDPALAGRAAGALGNIGDRHAVEPLISLLEHGEAAHDRLAAIHALGQIGDPRAVAPLVDRYEIGSKTEQFVIPGILGEIGDRCAVAPLRRILARLESESPESDDAAARLFTRCRWIKEAINEIARANGDPEIPI